MENACLALLLLQCLSSSVNGSRNEDLELNCAYGGTKKARQFLNAVKSFETFNVLVGPVRRLTVAAEESQPVGPTQSWHDIMCSHVGIGAFSLLVSVGP